MWPNPQFPVDLVTFTEEIRIGKVNFLCSLESPCSLFNSLRGFCSSAKVDRNFCSSSLWCFILVNFILLLIFSALLLVANCGCWLNTFVVKSFDSIVKSFDSYSFWADSENTGIPRPQNLGGRDINFLSMSEQFISLVIASMNSVLMTSCSCLS